MLRKVQSLVKKDELIELGFCSKAHGIKGGFTFILSNPEDSILKEKSKLFLFPKNASSNLDSNGELHQISKITFGHKVIVYLDGVSDRNRVEEMIPFTIKVSREDFPKTHEDEFYIVDLIGLKVISHTSKEDIGVVEGFYDNSAQIILKLSGGVELPFLDQFVPVVDLDEGLIEVIIPEVV